MKQALSLLALSSSFLNAGLADRRGLWDLDSSFSGYYPSYAPLDASSLTAGTDYSFATDGAGYTYLQTQVFTPAAKRLTVTNPIGANGGVGATRTNQWTVVMDVKFDAMQPFAGLIQCDPANASDVSFYVRSSDNITGTLVASGDLSAVGAFSLNTWYRLAITCGNNGSGGAQNVRCYINGVPSGVTRTSLFDGVRALRSSFHLFSDDNAELKPAKLACIALWGEELSASDIASLGGPQPAGIVPQGTVDPANPPAYGSTIASSNPYAWGANIGWIHARPSANWGVAIGEYVCSGHAWSANCGWITFGDNSPANGIRYGNTLGSDSGVNHDGLGNLYGLAWSANLGWINFGSNNIGSQKPTTDPNRPRFSLSSGQFAGYAWSANAGWIDLSTLRTATMNLPDTDADGIADSWERQNFTYLTRANATTDSDGDGVPDKDEYIAGTNPNDNTSRLRIVSQGFTGSGSGTWSLTFTSSPSRLYRVQRSIDLGTVTPWSNITAFTAPDAGAQTVRNFVWNNVPKDFVRVQASVPLQP